MPRRRGFRNNAAGAAWDQYKASVGISIRVPNLGGCPSKLLSEISLRGRKTLAIDAEWSIRAMHLMPHIVDEIRRSKLKEKGE